MYLQKYQELKPKGKPNRWLPANHKTKPISSLTFNPVMFATNQNKIKNLITLKKNRQTLFLQIDFFPLFSHLQIDQIKNGGNEGKRKVEEDTNEGGVKRPKLVVVTPRDRPKLSVRRPKVNIVTTAPPPPLIVEEPRTTATTANTGNDEEPTTTATATDVEKTATETRIRDESMDPINVLVDAAATVVASDEETDSDKYKDAVEEGEEESVDSERTMSDKGKDGSDSEASAPNEGNKGKVAVDEEAEKEVGEEEDAEEKDVEEEDAEQKDAEEVDAEEEDEEEVDAEEEDEEEEDAEEEEKDAEEEVAEQKDAEEENAEDVVETEYGRDNVNEEVHEPTEVIKPAKMYFSVSEYNKKIKLSTRCFIREAVETLQNLRPKLTTTERLWFEEHPQFRHFFHMKREKSHKVQGMWMLLLRACEIERQREVWFIVNGVPIRYGLREHALISGLNCGNYPLGYKEHGSTKFVESHFKKKNGELGLMRLEDVKLKLVRMGASRERLKMAVLYFLGSVICAQTKTGVGARNVLDFFQRAVDDLEYCKTFPWGRYSYDYMLKEISHTLQHFGGVVKENSLWPLPGFCIPLQVLAFDAIPKLGHRFRVSVAGADPLCPRMCRWSFKPNGMRGVPLSDIYQEMGDDVIDIHSIIPALSEEEEAMLEEIYESDDDVDKVGIAVESWEKRPDEGYPIIFEDMFNEDVAARSKAPEPVVEGEEGAHQSQEAGGEVSTMMKMMKKMMKQLGRVEKKVGTFEARMDSMEEAVKEVQKGKKKK